MAAMGLGQDGYLRVQKQVAYGTPITTSMTDIPALDGTFLHKVVSNIEQANLISSRLKQAHRGGG